MMLRTLERNLELTNRNLNTSVVPQIRPHVLVDTRTVLAGKGPQRRIKRALAHSAGF
jgi:hypothetical protein